MRTEIPNVGDDMPTAILLRECVAKTVGRVTAVTLAQRVPLWRMLEPKEGRRRPRSQVSETSMIAPKLAAPLAQFSQRYVTVVRRDLASWARRPSSAGKGSAQVALTVKRPHM